MAIIIVGPVAGKHHEGTTMPKVIDILKKKNDISPEVAFFIVTGRRLGWVQGATRLALLHYCSRL